MLSKKDKLLQALRRFPALCCPTCGGEMTIDGDSLRCGGGHRVNINRKGFVNVLSSPVDTCYDARLFQARSRVFASGAYDGVADAIAAMPGDGAQRILDAGCGDGWYLNTLLTRRSDWCGAGIDISRDAIAQAAGQKCEAVWTVGDLRRLPFADGSFTVVLDVLTPANYAEFARVLVPGGLLIKVYPGREYLREIRQARGMALYEEGQVDAYLQEKTEVIQTVRVLRTVAAEDALWRDFVWMTPLNQDLGEEEKNALALRNPGCITVDLHVTACRIR